MNQKELEQHLADLRAACPEWDGEGDEVTDLIVGLQSRVIRLEDAVAAALASLTRIERLVRGG